MKRLAVLSMVFFSSALFAQNTFPSFLVGTWKMEKGETYEHWDQLGKTSMKGYGYEIKNGETKITEYLDLTNRENGIYYTATVIGQNDGKGTDFKLTQSDSTFVFENPEHDFPKKIIYKKRSATEIYVQVLGAKERGFSYKMTRINIETPSKKETIPVIDESVSTNPNYDAELAKKLGADDYGMKSYMFVVLTSGSNTTTDKAIIDSCFSGHMGNIQRLVDEGKLIVAGPFQKNDKNYRGLFIFNVATKEEAEALLATDPAVNANLLDYEMYGWYGSAALPEYLEASDKVWKTGF